MLFKYAQWSIEFSDYSSLSVLGSIIKNAFGIYTLFCVTEVVLVTGSDVFDFDDSIESPRWVNFDSEGT